MFTRTTRNYGIWKKTHPSQIRYVIKSNSYFIFSLGIATFIALLVFIIIGKIKKDFFLIESSFLNINTIDKNIVNLAYNKRKVFATIAIIQEKNNNIGIMFDSGDYFLYPEKEKKIKNYILHRYSKLEYISMLALTEISFASRLEIWPEKNISTQNFFNIINFFNKLGFDDFDIAFKMEKHINDKQKNSN